MAKFGQDKYKDELGRPIVNCYNCGKKGVATGQLGLPSGWISWDSPLFDKPWIHLFCSMTCKSAARIRDALKGA